MGMEVISEGPAASPAPDATISDSEAIYNATFMIREALILATQGDKTPYNQVIEEITTYDPSDPVQESMLAMTLRALSGAISSIDYNYHKSLLCFIFDMSMWNCGPDVADAWVQFIVDLAASNSGFVDECLIKLVGNFLPPTSLSLTSMSLDSFTTRLVINGLDRNQLMEKTAEYLSRKEVILPRVHMALESIIHLVPKAPLKLGALVVHGMPKKHEPKNFNVLYLENMLRLERGIIGEYLRNDILRAVVCRLVDLDVDIKWEDILKEDCSKCIFDMELEDGEENETESQKGGAEVWKTNLGRERLGEVADKLDVLMDATFEHVKLSYEEGRLSQIFDVLMESFRLYVLNTSRSKFAQFVMFYACSLDPEKCGERFGIELLNIFLSSFEPRITRMSAIAYLASYLSRARFLPSYFVARTLDRVGRWCLEYYESCQKKSVDPEAHQVFYSGCQAVIYVLCFRMRSLMEVPQLKALLFQMPLDVILNNTLEPLSVCLPSIVEEFLKQADGARLFKSKGTLPEGLLDSLNSKAYGGIERLDMFFPFDPYLLKKSDRFISPHFTFWSMVEAKYEEDDDSDISDVDTNDGDEGDFYAGNGELGQSLTEVDIHEFESSMNMMSITPKDSMKSRFAGSPTLPEFGRLIKMPAKLRPSTSPDW
ncbi:uncharacterized protein LOC116256794 [Nymphaea colorata]|nr:uncharacterized protein LOC116256794 [Nymphaea colorata]